MGDNLIGMAPQEVRHAMEEDDTHDRTPELYRALPDSALAHDRAVHARRHQSSNRRQVAATLLARGPLGAPGAESCSPLLSPPHRSRSRPRAVGGQAFASALATPEDPALPGSALPCSRVASREQRRRALPHSGAVSVHAATTPAAASGSPCAPRRFATRGVDGRFHRAIPYRRRGVLLAAHRGGRLLALSTELHGPALHAAGGGPAHLRTPLPRRW